MVFCTKCGNSVADDSSFCAKCGGARPNAEAPLPGAAAVPGNDPSKELSKFHTVRLFLAFVGMVTVILVAAAVNTGGELAVGFFAVLATAAFVLLLVPRFAARVRERTRMRKVIDPRNGESLPMLWWL